MRLHFTKMEGTGNDYIFFDCLESDLEEPAKVAKMLSRRHFSVGSDGIVLICRSKIADVRMRIFNSNGSEAKMCGNAVRCVAKLIYDCNFVRKSRIKIETESGIREVFLTVRNGSVEKITVDMGVVSAGEVFILETNGEKFEMRAVDVGNPHQVAFLPDVDFLDFEKIGRSCEKNLRFEDGVNTEFCEILGKNHLKVRVFERGSGETLACGTGACASAVAAIKNGMCEVGKPIKISMRGGELSVLCDENFHTYLTGDAHVTFQGEAEI